MQWRDPRSIPLQPGVYRVQVPFPYLPERATHMEPRWARWTGSYWTCWAVERNVAAYCEFRGPSAGYMWAESES
jgi:hypothetical protein